MFGGGVRVWFSVVLAQSLEGHGHLDLRILSILSLLSLTAKLTFYLQWALGRNFLPLSQQ